MDRARRKNLRFPDRKSRGGASKRRVGSRASSACAPRLATSTFVSGEVCKGKGKPITARGQRGDLNQRSPAADTGRRQLPKDHQHGGANNVLCPAPARRCAAARGAGAYDWGRGDNGGANAWRAETARRAVAASAPEPKCAASSCALARRDCDGRRGARMAHSPQGPGPSGPPRTAGTGTWRGSGRAHVHSAGLLCRVFGSRPRAGG